MTHNDPPDWIENTNPVDHTKPLAALTAAGLVGFILGINYVASAADTRVRPTESVPAWVGQVEVMQFAAMACLLAVIGGWMYLDYHQEVRE